MTPAGLKLIAGFEAVAVASEEAETKLRKAVAAQVAQAERERTFAFRRVRFVRLLTTSASGAADEPSALTAQSRAVCEEFGWSSENPAHKEIIERLKPLGLAVWACACDAPENMQSGATESALLDFERWFEEARGRSFYMLFETYVPDTPLVDF